MPNLEDLTSNSRDFKYVCLHPWEKEERPRDNPLEEQPRIYVEDIPDDEYIREEPESPYDPYKPKRGVTIIPL